MKFWKDKLHQFDLDALEEAFIDINSVTIGPKNYKNYYFSPINDFVLTYECHFNNCVIHSLNDIYTTTGMYSGSEYTYWLHKQDFNNWSIQKKYGPLYISLEQSRLSSTVDMSANVLWDLRENDRAYILMWVYLIILQLRKDKFSNDSSNNKLLGNLLNQIYNDDSLKGVKRFIDNDFKRWIIPTGLIYTKIISLPQIIDPEMLITLVFHEINYIRANYQMCYCFERWYEGNCIFDLNKDDTFHL